MSRDTASSTIACGRRPEGAPLGDTDQVLELLDEVERRLIRRDEVVDQRDRQPASLAADVLVAILVDDVVAAAFTGHAARLADVRLRAGQALQLERDVLRDVAQPGAVLQARNEPAAPAERAGVVLERRNELDQGLVEAGDRVARKVLEHAEIDEHRDRRAARPDVRPAQDARVEDAQRRLGLLGGCHHRLSLRRANRRPGRATLAPRGARGDRDRSGSPQAASAE